MNFGFWGSEPQTLNLRYRWYGGICRGCKEGSCGERIFRLSLSVPEIFDLKFDILTSFAYKPEVGGAKWRHHPVGVDGAYNPSVGHDIADSRSGDIRLWIFCQFPLMKKCQLTFLLLGQKNTIDGVDNKLLHTQRDRSRFVDAYVALSDGKT